METLKLSLFIENPDNPQTVTDEAFEDLLKSVRESPETLEASRIAYCTDYVSPITGVSYVGQRVVMAGNKRLRALKKIYGEDAEVNAAWFFDLTPLGVEARRRWLVRSNIQTGEWETNLLMKLYSKDELSSLMSADAVPAVDAAETPVSRGGVYMLGDSRLMCGDSTALADVLRLMGGEKADLLLTDPPYNVDYKGAAGKILNDKQGDADFLKFLVAAFKAADVALNLYARQIALQQMRLRDEPVYVAIASVIGRPEISVQVLDRHNYTIDEWEECRPAHEIIDQLHLREPIYARMCRYGLFHEEGQDDAE